MPKSTPELHHISAWMVRGATDLDPKGEFELLSMSNPNVQVLLTSDPKTWSEHIDRCAAIGEIVFRAGLADTPEKEKLRREVMQTVQAERQKAFPRGVFLILNGVKPYVADLSKCRRIDSFGVVFDAADNDSVRDEFQPYLAGAIAATLSALPGVADRRVERIAGATFFIDPVDDRPIYNLSIRTGSATLSVVGPLAADSVPAISRNAALLARHETLSKVTRLLLAATVEPETYGRFVLSWGALEMFIHSIFRERYQTVAEHARADSSSALGRIMRPYLKEGHDAFPVRARFAAIAHTLSPHDVMQDTLEFGYLKHARDMFIHTGKQPDLDNTARRSRALLLKLLGLELSGRA